MFGKTIENIRKRQKIELVNNEKGLNKFICKPVYLESIIYDETLCAVRSAKETIPFNKPIYIGFSVLELSKTVMYNFFYNVFRKKYGLSNMNLLYMDTNSFFLEIISNNIYKDLLDADFVPQKTILFRYLRLSYKSYLLLW